MRRLLLSLALYFSAHADEPSKIWEEMQRGNKEYIAGRIEFHSLAEAREELLEHQSPPVTVLACSDSRVPPELIFHRSLGTLFVIRTAGNVADGFGIASIEYAVAQGYTKLIVVLGHQNCGAVKASLTPSDPPTPSLDALMTRIRSSFIGITYDTTDVSNVRRAVKANARSSAAHLLAASSLLREAVRTKKVKLMTAYYDLQTGLVTEIE